MHLHPGRAAEPCDGQLIARARTATSDGRLLFVLSPTAEASPERVRRSAASSDGVWYWDLPETPNGLRPLIAYSGAGSRTGRHDLRRPAWTMSANSAPLRCTACCSEHLRAAGLTLQLRRRRTCGLRSRRQLPVRRGDREVPHSACLARRQGLSCANLNDSTQSAAYLDKRGFHWYAYDEAAGTFEDLSVTEPGGVGAHRRRDCQHRRSTLAAALIYGSELPTGNLYAYDIARRTTTLLGRPAYGRPHVYANRAMWLDRRGRVYLTAATRAPDHGAPYNPAIFNHVHYYDPDHAHSSDSATGWKLRSQHAIDAAQCFQRAESATSPTISAMSFVSLTPIPPPGSIELETHRRHRSDHRPDLRQQLGVPRRRYAYPRLPDDPSRQLTREDSTSATGRSWRSSGWRAATGSGRPCTSRQGSGSRICSRTARRPGRTRRGHRLPSGNTPSTSADAGEPGRLRRGVPTADSS